MKKLLIAIDAGHGGWDNGAQYMGRLEKDDNLRLALEVEKQLIAQDIDVLMTRQSDVYVTLQERVEMANTQNADLFVSLHRNSYTENTSSTKGIENFIYLTAPMETTGRAAKLVLDNVVNVAAQADRGVSRGNFYVLRRTDMPAMLLEMGFIINELDNKLFDDNLVEYAKAISSGILTYFGYTCNPDNFVCKAPTHVNPISEAQMLVNKRYNMSIPVTGVYDDETRFAMTMLLQATINNDFGTELEIDGILGPKTFEEIPVMQMGQSGNVVYFLQAILQIRGYDPGALDGVYSLKTENAVRMFQRDNYLVTDGMAGPITISALLS